MHVFHPKVVHTDHSSSVQFLHSRNDPVGGLKGSFSQPKPHTEYRISEEDFNKWRQEQQRRALEKRKRQQQQKQQQQQQQPDDEEEYDENVDEEEEANYDDELFKKHRANKENSAALSGKKENKNHKNHNYSPDYDSSNADKVYAKHPSNKSNNKKQQRPNRPSSKRTRPDEFKQYQVYGITNVDAESSNVEQQYTSIDPTAIDPGYYSTLPRDVKNVPATNQDDIYSGLISKKFNKNIEDKSKLLADINYNRKQQTKNLLQRRRGQ